MRLDPATATLIGVLAAQVVLINIEYMRVRRERASHWRQRKQEVYAKYLSALDRQIGYFEIGSSHPSQLSYDKAIATHADLSHSYDLISLVAPLRMVGAAKDVQDSVRKILDAPIGEEAEFIRELREVRDAWVLKARLDLDAPFGRSKEDKRIRRQLDF